MQYRTRRAFTLIELAVVTAIVAVVAAIAVPRLASSMANQRVNAAARRVAADLSLAAAHAKAASTTRTVVFDAAAGTYTLTDETALDRSTGPYVIKLAAEPYRVTVPEVNFNNTATASFDGYGRPANGGYVKVQSGGITRTITLDATSGKAVIQ